MTFYLKMTVLVHALLFTLLFSCLYKMDTCKRVKNPDKMLTVHEGWSDVQMCRHVLLTAGYRPNL